MGWVQVGPPRGPLPSFGVPPVSQQGGAAVGARPSAPAAAPPAAPLAAAGPSPPRRRSPRTGGDTQKPTRVSGNAPRMPQMSPQSNRGSPRWWFGGSRGGTCTQNHILGCCVPPSWVNHLSRLGDAAGSLRGGRRIRPPPVCWLLLHGSAVWG